MPVICMRKIVRRGRGTLGRSVWPWKFSLWRGPRANCTVKRSPLKSLPSATRRECQKESLMRSFKIRTKCWDNVPGIHGILIFDKAKPVHDLDIRDFTGAMTAKVVFDVLFGDWKEKSNAVMGAVSDVSSPRPQQRSRERRANARDVHGMLCHLRYYNISLRQPGPACGRLTHPPLFQSGERRYIGYLQRVPKHNIQSLEAGAEKRAEFQPRGADISAGRIDEDLHTIAGEIPKIQSRL